MSVGAVIEVERGAYAQLGPDGWDLHSCPDGTAVVCAAKELPREGPVRIVLQSGEPRDLAGLFGMLCSITGVGREKELAIIHPLFDEATPSIVEAWLKSVRPDFPVSLESA